MKRDPRAFLSDVMDASCAIQMASDDISINDYCRSRLNHPSY